MGYNRALVQDESVSFVVTFSSAEPGAALSVCGLKSGGLLLEKTVTRCAIEADRNPTRVKGANNVLVYREVTDHRITFVYQNKSESSSTVQMELTKSKGIVHSRESEVFLSSFLFFFIPNRFLNFLLSCIVEVTQNQAEDMYGPFHFNCTSICLLDTIRNLSPLFVNWNTHYWLEGPV